MPERSKGRDRRWDLNRIRDSLIAGTAGVEITTDALSARVSDVPLFQRTEDGQLRQAIRISAQAETALDNVTWTLSHGESIVDRVTGQVGASPSSHLLMVPELDAPTTFRLAIHSEALAPFVTEITAFPQRKWSVFLIHHSHLDIGYTDPQASVLQSQLDYLDAALDYVGETDDWPDASRFRWNVETTWPLQHWLQRRPAAARDAFLKRVKEGRIEVNALPFSMHSEAYSLDELARQLWFTDELRERYGLEIVSAMQTDVPGATVGLATLLTDAGIQYLAVAHNYAGRSVPHLVGGQALTRPFYWAAPDGQKLLVWYTDTPNGVAYMEGNLAGLATDYETALASLPEYLNAVAQRPYPYGKEAFGWAGIPDGIATTKQPYPYDILHLRVQGVIADNAAPSLTPAAIAREWNEHWAYPHVRMATNQEFFAAAEERIGDQLETYHGDWTDWWADGIGSGARALGFNRQAQSGIRAAQTLHALTDAMTGDPEPEVQAEVARAYEDMALFDEHTWGAANPWEDGLSRMASGMLQWERKAAFAHAAHEQTNAILDAGLHRFASLGASSPTVATVVVFNPSSWDRTDLVRVFLPESRTGGEPHLVLMTADTQTPIPYVSEDQDHADFRPRGQWMSFIAQDVPAIGYARYEVVRAGEPTPDAGQTSQHAPSPALENEHFALELNAREGYVESLADKATGRELIDRTAPHGFNQYIYDRYTSAPGFNHLSSRVIASDLSLLGSRSTANYGVITRHSSNAVWDRVTLRLTGEGVHWLESTFTLLHDVPRLDISNRLQKIATRQKESVYFAFPFALSEPSFTAEVTGGVVSEGSPRVPGSANHFRAIRHWITTANETEPPLAWASAEAPLVQLGNIHLPYAPFPETIDPDDARPGTIYSWALNNIWDTNFPSEQGGEMTFRYAIGTGGQFGARELGNRTAAGVTTPLLGVCRPSVATPSADLPARGSFCAVDDPDIQITHLAPSRRGHDLVLFLSSVADEVREVHVSFDLFPVARAWHGTFLERNLQAVSIDANSAKIMLEPGAYSTLSVDLAPRP